MSGATTDINHCAFDFGPVKLLMKLLRLAINYSTMSLIAEALHYMDSGTLTLRESSHGIGKPFRFVWLCLIPLIRGLPVFGVETALLWAAFKGRLSYRL